MEKRLVIAGSRYFNDYEFFEKRVREYLSEIENGDEIIILSGHCSGTDYLAEKFAEVNQYKLELFPADWKLGKRAGPLRNKAMVDVADYALAFSSGGNGTESLILFAKQKGIPIKVHYICLD